MAAGEGREGRESIGGDGSGGPAAALRMDRDDDDEAGAGVDADAGEDSDPTAFADDGGEDDDDDDDDEVMDEEDLTASLSSALEGVAGDDGRRWSTMDDEDLAAAASSEDDLSHLPRGTPDDYYVVHKYPVPQVGFDVSAFGPDDVSRLGLTADNVTVPAALMLLDPTTYPSLSRARKACRKGNVLIHRGPLVGADGTTFDPDRCSRGRVGDRVFPGDVVAKQVRMGGGFYPSLTSAKPPFELPVIYEDDHFAIVNKPAGVVVYSSAKGGHGRMTVRSALPFVLRPPRTGTEWILRRPQPVHRLDKPTSGLLLVAKTKPAMVELARQFVERRVRKTYSAVVNGIPFEEKSTAISSRKARDLGVDVSPGESSQWQIVDHPLEGKSAVTVWRALRYSNSLKARDGTLTLVELKPKTGRFHQLRRHMAWDCQRPVVGDPIYAGGLQARYFRERGLFLCSNEVSLEHPYYNTEEGRREWEAMECREDKYRGGMVRLSEDGTTVEVRASIELPKKFLSLLDWEEERAEKFSSSVDDAASRNE